MTVDVSSGSVRVGGGGGGGGRGRGRPRGAGRGSAGARINRYKSSFNLLLRPKFVPSLLLRKEEILDNKDVLI